MSYVLLAGVLGAITIATVVLLFRRLRRDLDRQLTAISAERDSEWILRGMRRAQNEQGRGERAANGDLEPPPPLPGLIRTKGGLHLLRGGLGAAVVLALAGALRRMWSSHPAQLLVAATATVAVASTAAAVLTLAPWDTDDDNRPTPSLPTAQQPTVRPTSSPPPTAGPPSTPTASASPGPTATGAPSTGPATPTATAGPQTTAGITPDGITGPGHSGTHGPPQSPPGQTRRPSGPPGRTHTPGPPTTPPGQTRRPVTAPGRGLCAGVTLPPVVDAGACLGGA